MRICVCVCGTYKVPAVVEYELPYVDHDVRVFAAVHDVHCDPFLGHVWEDLLGMKRGGGGVMLECMCEIDWGVVKYVKYWYMYVDCRGVGLTGAEAEAEAEGGV